MVVADDTFPLTVNTRISLSLIVPWHKVNGCLITDYPSRRVAENEFGILPAKFRILRAPIRLPLGKTKAVVLACLHNYLSKNRIEQTTNNDSITTADNDDGEGPITRCSTMTATTIEMVFSPTPCILLSVNPKEWVARPYFVQTVNIKLVLLYGRHECSS